MSLRTLEHMGLYALSFIGAGSFGLWQSSFAAGLWMYVLLVLIHLYLTLFSGIRVLLREGHGVDTDA